MVASVPAQIRARRVHVSLGARDVLRDLSVTVGPGTRVALLGPNGVGKSTLLRTLAGLLAPSEGSVERAPSTATVGYLSQELFTQEEETLRDSLRRRTGIAETQAEIVRLERTMGEDLDLITRYTGALERLEALGGYDLDTRAAESLADLGLPSNVLYQPVATLSGGQRARAGLAAITLSRFDLLLLDEPANDLDLDGLAMLERFVTSFRGGMVVVSHDREFLDRCVDRFIELDPFTHQAATFSGSWTDYERIREHEREHALAEHERTSAERDRLLKRARAVRTESASGAARVKRSGEPDKYIRFAKTSGAQQHAAQAARLERKAARIRVTEKPRESWQLQLDLSPSERGSDLVVRLESVTIVRGTFRLGPADLHVGRGERIAVLGPNGSGKSTLLDAVLGEAPIAQGSRRVGAGVVLGAIRQDRTMEWSTHPLLATFLAATGLPHEAARTLLAKFDLGTDDVERPGDELSPGERTRATLAVLMARKTNCLILDEPSNHLDIQAIEELERSLASFPGTFLLVTHDRRLSERVGITRSIQLDGGRITADA